MTTFLGLLSSFSLEIIASHLPVQVVVVIVCPVGPRPAINKTNRGELAVEEASFPP